MTLFLSVSCSFRKTSAELYEARARGHIRSLRSSQISTHLGLDGQRRSPALPALARAQPRLNDVAAAPVASSQGAIASRVQEADRRSLLEVQPADQLHGL